MLVVIVFRNKAFPGCNTAGQLLATCISCKSVPPLGPDLSWNRRKQRSMLGKTREARVV